MKTIRYMTNADLSAVMEIEDESFNFPWSIKKIIETIKRPTVLSKVICVGDCDNQEIAGFVIYELLKSELQIIDFAVAESARRQGIGAKLMNHLVGGLSKSIQNGFNRTRVVVGVAEDDFQSMAFLKSQGFTVTGRYDFPAGNEYRLEYRFKKQPVHKFTNRFSGQTN